MTTTTTHPFLTEGEHKQMGDMAAKTFLGSIVITVAAMGLSRRAFPHYAVGLTTGFIVGATIATAQADRTAELFLLKRATDG